MDPEAFPPFAPSTCGSGPSLEISFAKQAAGKGEGVNDNDLRSAEAMLAGHPLVGGSVLLEAVVLLSAAFSALKGAFSKNNGGKRVRNEGERGE